MLNKFNRPNVSKTKLHKTPEEAIYHGLVLGQSNGAYPIEKIRKEDGSFKSMKFSEASEEDRKRVFEYLKG